MDNIKSVVFDIDGTLAPEVSWISLTRELGGSPEEHLQIYEAYKNNLDTYEQSRDKLLKLWRDTGNATRSSFTRIFEKLPLVSGAEDIVRCLNEKYEVAIITGSMDLYASTVSAKVGVTNYYANTSLFWDENGILAGMEYELNQSQKKVSQFLGFCSAKGFEPNECLVVGDSENDIGLFKLTTYGIAIGDPVPSELASVSLHQVKNLNELNALLIK